MGSMRRRAWSTLTVTALCVGLVACQGAPPVPPPASTPAPSLSASEPATEVSPVEPTGTTRDIATGLDAPWSIAILDDGSALISERDTARIIELTPEGSTRVAGTIGGVRHGGEGGLLGIEAVETDGEVTLYAYHTAEGDNRVIRMPLLGEPGTLSLGTPEVVLAGIPRAGNHNGGRIKLGPDGHLYVTTGDAGDPSLSQDPASLAGKILRMTLTGGVPGDNPFAGSLVWSMGHRNPQGIAWDSNDRLWAAEFGQNTWDELNLILPGANYGWPTVEGEGGDARFRDPIEVWSTAEASPSGLAILNDSIFMAALRGQRVWTVYTAVDATGAVTRQPDAVPWFTNELGRIRDVVVTPNGALWALTNNTDGRGSPRPGDDRLIEVELRQRD